MIAVIDTNVVASGLITRNADAPTAVILDRMLEGGFSFLLSKQLVSEYRRVLLRRRIRNHHRLGPRKIDIILTEIIANAIMVEPDAPGTPGDEHLMALLESRKGASLVTGDRKLLASTDRSMSPARFVQHYMLPACGAISGKRGQASVDHDRYLYGDKRR
jgi:predicted nucleic acid-binding protein